MNTGFSGSKVKSAHEPPFQIVRHFLFAARAPTFFELDLAPVEEPLDRREAEALAFLDQSGFQLHQSDVGRSTKRKDRVGLGFDRRRSAVAALRLRRQVNALDLRLATEGARNADVSDLHERSKASVGPARLAPTLHSANGAFPTCDTLPRVPVEFDPTNAMVNLASRADEFRRTSRRENAPVVPLQSGLSDHFALLSDGLSGGGSRRLAACCASQSPIERPLRTCPPSA